MAYGLEIINSNGILQLTDGITQYHLVEEGTATSVFPASFDELMFVRPNTYGQWLHLYRDVVGNYGLVKSADGQPFKYRKYRRFIDATPSTEVFGLRLYNGDGQLTFDSGKRPLVIESVITIRPTFEAEWYIYPENSIPLSGPYSAFERFIGLNGVPHAYQYQMNGFNTNYLRFQFTLSDNNTMKYRGVQESSAGIHPSNPFVPWGTSPIYIQIAGGT